MISSAEQKRREAAVRYARATVALEGGQQTPIAAEQLARFVAGDISIEQAIELVRQSYGLPKSVSAAQVDRLD
ncbi:antitoxin VbhA family protein [Pseudomonas sp. 2FG]|uniref:antitoxin VbhA family protein n=1 Tax=Pseudomonas sp. 2FG TaxID=2502191 RepID=UPI001485A43B